MNRQDAKKRIEQLRKTIERCRYAYHVLDKSLISDAALDSLKKELFDLEQQWPDLITPDSPTQRIGGAPLKDFKKVRHETPMLSFNDAFSREDMEDWLKRLENYLGRKITGRDRTFYCELKIDGLAIELTYEDGVLVQGSTRGDGLVGEDVTQNLKTVEAIPLKLKVESFKSKVPKHLVVRGEVFLTKKEFNRINKEQEKLGGKLYANPRNVAAGSVRQLDPKVISGRKLDSFQYDIVADFQRQYHEDEHQLLKSFGCKINQHNSPAATLKEVFDFHEYWSKHREALPYEVDGIVVIVNSNKDFNSGGVIGKAPRAAIAFKFAAREATTIVEDIKVQVGRTGALTPVAVLKPVPVGGITISHATLHNADEIKRLGLRIGDTVIVSRAGDVIPKITKVLKELRPRVTKEFEMPKKCPVDGAPVVRDGVAYKCGNKNCGARNREGLYHFVSRKAFNIEGLGPKIIDRFMDEGLIGDAADIFELQAGDIKVLERFGEKSAENIVREVQEKKKITLPRFLFSLGILHVGEETARVLARTISGASRATGVIQVRNYLQKFSLEALQEMQDIGPKVAQSIYDWFHDARNIKFLEKLDRVGITILPERHTASATLKGKLFALTGGLKGLSRDEAKDNIRARGGEVSESVSKKTSYVVAGSDAGSKLEKAKKLGVPVLEEKDFLKML